MRIVQTFWTGGHDPLMHGFGWPHPEYNLMSWALSCLSLREHYDEVVLYTDSAGKRILIDELRLPYTDVQVVFDDFPCLPQHWALAKIKTYSLQTKPFLHVDGDIYVPRPLPEDVLSAPLIAQNREIGTIYYRRMIDRLLSYPEVIVPEYVQKTLSEESIASYNMGFFGGSDLEYIRHYCDMSFRFIDENRMNDPSVRYSHVVCNIFFEQIIFAALADAEHRDVACLLQRLMTDKGYMAKDFCDLSHFREHPFFHILGGHKRSADVLPALEQATLRLYPDYYRHILSLFPERHVRFAQSREIQTMGYLSVERSIAQYEDFVEETKCKWSKLPPEEIFNFEKQTASNITFNFEDESLYDSMWVSGVHQTAVFHIPSEWNPKAVKMVKERIGCIEQYPLRHIALSPSIRLDGVRETAVGNMDMQILALLENGEMTFPEVVNHLYSEVSFHSTLERMGAYRHVLHQINYLSQNRLIMTYNKK